MTSSHPRRTAATKSAAKAKVVAKAKTEKGPKEPVGTGTGTRGKGADSRGSSQSIVKYLKRPAAHRDADDADGSQGDVNSVAVAAPTGRMASSASSSSNQVPGPGSELSTPEGAVSALGPLDVEKIDNKKSADQLASAEEEPNSKKLKPAEEGEKPAGPPASVVAPASYLKHILSCCDDHMTSAFLSCTFPQLN